MACATVAATPVLLLHGPTGVGKTHLLRAVGDSFAARNPNRPVMFTTAADLAAAFVDAIRGDRVDDFHASHRGVALLVIDDLHQLMDKTATQQALGMSLARSVATGTRIVGAATAPRAVLASFRAALRAAAAIRQCEMRRPNQREMRAILKALAAERSIAISRQVQDRVGRRSRGDVRRAIGALAHLKAVATFPGGNVDPPWIEDFAVRSNW